MSKIHTTTVKAGDLRKDQRILFDSGTPTVVTAEPQRRGSLVDVALEGVPYTYDADEDVQWVTTEVLTEDEFDARFTLVEFLNGSCTLDRAEQSVMQQFPENQVWTLVDTDEGQALCSGFAVVNFIGWQVTEEPHPGGNGDIVVEMPDEYPYTCETCLQAIRQDDKGVWVDNTEGDVCMDNDGVDGKHKPEEDEG